MTSTYPRSWDKSGVSEDVSMLMPPSIDEMMREIHTNKVISAYAVVGKKYLQADHLENKRKREELSESYLEGSSMETHHGDEKAFLFAETIREFRAAHALIQDVDIAKTRMLDRGRRLAEWRTAVLKTRQLRAQM